MIGTEDIDHDLDDLPPIVPHWTGPGEVDPDSLIDCMVFAILKMKFPELPDRDIAFFVRDGEEDHQLDDEGLIWEVGYEAEDLRGLTSDRLTDIYKHMCFSAGRSAPHALDGDTEGWIFDQPEADADFPFWMNMAYWNLQEAVALSLGKDPRLVNEKALRKIYLFDTLAFPKKYMKWGKWIRRAQQSGDLPKKIRPAEFSTWAAENNLEIPTELTDLIKRPADPAGFRHIENLSWNEVTITLLSGGHVQISARGITKKAPLGELKLLNKTTNQPNKSFELLAALSGNSRRVVRVNSKLKDIAYELRKSLKTYFGITSNPLPAQGKNYVARFGLIDKRDAADRRDKEKASRSTVPFDEQKLSHQRGASLQGEADSSLGFGPDDDGHPYDEEDDMVDDKASRWIAEHDG